MVPKIVTIPLRNRPAPTEYSGARWHGAVSGVLRTGATPPAVLRLLGECRRPHQVMGKRVPQHHGFYLIKPAHQKLCEPAPARNGVNTLSGGGALLVNLLGRFTAHALAPLGKRFAVIGQRHIRITAGVSRVAHRSIDRGATAVGIFDVSIAGKAAVGEPFGGALLIALFNLVEHRGELARVAATVVHFNSHNDLSIGGGAQLHIVTGRNPPSAIFITRASGSVLEARGSVRFLYCSSVSFSFLAPAFLFFCFST